MAFKIFQLEKIIKLMWHDKGTLPFHSRAIIAFYMEKQILCLSLPLYNSFIRTLCFGTYVCPVYHVEKMYAVYSGLLNMTSKSNQKDLDLLKFNVLCIIKASCTDLWHCLICSEVIIALKLNICKNYTQ